MREREGVSDPTHRPARESERTSAAKASRAARDHFDSYENFMTLMLPRNHSSLTGWCLRFGCRG